LTEKSVSKYVKSVNNKYLLINYRQI